MTVLNENPINNEPGYEKLKLSNSYCKKYNFIIEHANIRVGILKMIKDPPPGFNMFNTDISNYFLNNYNWYEEKCLKYLKNEKNKTLIKSPIYSWTEDVDFNNLLSEITDLKNTLLNKII